MKQLKLANSHPHYSHSRSQSYSQFPFRAIHVSPASLEFLSEPRFSRSRPAAVFTTRRDTARAAAINKAN